jgi:hypothetical protein
MKVAFGIIVNTGTPLLRRKGTQKFMDLVRMVMDIASGDSVVFNIGYQAASWARI